MERRSEPRKPVCKITKWLNELQERYPDMKIRKLFTRWNSFSPEVKRTYGFFEQYVTVVEACSVREVCGV